MRRVKLESTLLASAQYNPARRLLDVELRSGEIYRYFQVPPTSYEELLEADSKGRYYNQHIRNRFPYTHLSRPSSPIVLSSSKNED